MQGKTYSLRRRFYNLLEDGSDDLLPRSIRALLIFLILLSTVTSISASIPSVFARWGGLLRAFDLIVGSIFAIEYTLRIWAAPENPPWRKLSPWKARHLAMKMPASVIDFLAVIPFYLVIFDGISLQSFIVLRLLRFFKLVRYSAGLVSLADAVRQERHALAGCFVILAGLILVSSSAMYSVEGLLQPDKYGTIPLSMYWAVVTVTTVGYGDVTPITGLGKAITMVTAIGGMTMLALPAAIIATAFSLEVHRRDFIVNWGTVANVPLFAELDASELNAIVNRMRSRTFEAGEDVVRRNELVEYMYFVVSGQLERVSGRSTHVFKEGDYFGEVGILSNRTKWGVRIRAVTRCKLMMLKADELENLMDELPEMAAQIRQTAKERAEVYKLDEDTTEAT